MKIGITVGDPSGIGPEIVAAALQARPHLDVTVFGDAAHTLRGLVPVTRLAAADRLPGRPTPAGGAAQVAYLEAAVAAGCDALVTAPISKTQARAAGFDFPGHTEFLARRYGVGEDVAMLFAGPKLRVLLATIHPALADVPRVLTTAAVARAIRLGAEALRRDFGVPDPKIGVLGLNPHAGEHGQFGDEEARIIAPAIAAHPGRIEGPLVPDAAFRKPYDLYVAMYHDQGLIPVKLVDFDLSVNVTLGLPIVRTSPDHGVAYDIAGTGPGKGKVRAESFLAALDLAVELAENRRRAVVV